MVSIDGVAELRIIGQLEFFALIIAKSLAFIINLSSCLYDGSCSSSTTIIPKFLNGRNKEDRVPIIRIGTPLIT